jgi:Zn-finger nucleic acid-binding protein
MTQGQADADGAAHQDCPKCGSGLLHVERSGQTIELCSACRGVWLDSGELTTLLELYKRLDASAGAPTGARCPRGKQALKEVEFPGTGVRVDVCPDCQGIWLDAGELELLQRNVAALIPQNQATLEERARELLTQVERAEQLRFTCPKCQAKLWHIEREGNVVEVCSDCEGMWFDAGELTVLLGVYRRLEATEGAASGVSCVRCATELRELTFPGSAVQIDACPGCQGIYLDRGELEQLKANVAHLVDTSEQATLTERADQILDDLDRAAKERARCPKCQGELKGDREGGIHVERCVGCQGTWLDSGDLTRALGVSRKIRTKTDGQFTGTDCIRCPEGSELIVLPYPGTEVEIEICGDCRGVFLDAGELATLRSAVGRPG